MLGVLGVLGVLGRVPFGKIRYDNLKAAVAQILGFSRQRVENERWTAFRSHYGIESFYCRPDIEGARGRRPQGPPLWGTLGATCVHRSCIGQKPGGRVASRPGTTRRTITPSL